MCSSLYVCLSAWASVCLLIFLWFMWFILLLQRSSDSSFDNYWYAINLENLTKILSAPLKYTYRYIHEHKYTHIPPPSSYRYTQIHIYPSIYSIIFVAIYLLTCLSVFLSIYPSISQSIFSPSVSKCPSICLSIGLHVHLSTSFHAAYIHRGHIFS